MSRVVRVILVIVAVVVPVVLADAWGRSWATRGYEDLDCAGGTWFLADAGWFFEGVLLAAATALILPIVVTAIASYVVAVLALIAAGVGMSIVAPDAATRAAISVGCSPFSVRDAERAIPFGMVPVGIVTVGILGLVVLGRSVRRWRGRGPAGRAAPDQPPERAAASGTDPAPPPRSPRSP